MSLEEVKRNLIKGVIPTENDNDFIRDKLENKIREQAKRLVNSQNYIKLCEKLLLILKPNQTFPISENDLQLNESETLKKTIKKEDNINEDYEKLKEKYSLLVSKYKLLSIENDRLLETINIHSNRIEERLTQNKQKKLDSCNDFSNEKSDHQHETNKYRKELIISQVLISELKLEIENLKRPQNYDENSDKRLNENEIIELRNEHSKLLSLYHKLEKTRMNTQEDNKLLLKKVNELSNLLKDTRSKTEENQLEGKKSNEFKRTLHNSNASNGFNCVVHEKEIKDLEKENNLLQMMIFDKDRKNKKMEDQLASRTQLDKLTELDILEENNMLKNEIYRLKSEFNSNNKESLLSDEVSKTLRIIEKQTVDMKQENSNVNMMLTSEMKLKAKEVEIYIKEINDSKKIISEKNQEIFEKSREIEKLNIKIIALENELKINGDKELKFNQKKYEALINEKEGLIKEKTELLENKNREHELKYKKVKEENEKLNQDKRELETNLKINLVNNKDLITQIDLLTNQSNNLKDDIKCLSEENQILKTTEKELQYEISDGNTINNEIKLALYSTFSILKIYLHKIYNYINDDHIQLFSNNINEIMGKSIELSFYLPNEINIIEFIKYHEELTRSLLSELDLFYLKIIESIESEKDAVLNASYIEKAKTVSKMEMNSNIERKYKDQLKTLQDDNLRLQKYSAEIKANYDANLSELKNTVQLEKKAYFDELSKISTEFQELNNINTQLLKEKNDRIKVIDQLKLELKSLEDKNSILINQKAYLKDIFSKISFNFLQGKQSNLLNAICSLNEEKYQFEVERSNVNIRIKQLLNNQKNSDCSMDQEIESNKALSNSYLKKIVDYQNLLRKYEIELSNSKERNCSKDKSTRIKTTTQSNSSLGYKFNKATNQANISDLKSDTSYNSILDTDVYNTDDYKIVTKHHKRTLDTDFFKKF